MTENGAEDVGPRNQFLGIKSTGFVRPSGDAAPANPIKCLLCSHAATATRFGFLRALIRLKIDPV
jgi:hypothetical protein